MNPLKPDYNEANQIAESIMAQLDIAAQMPPSGAQTNMLAICYVAGLITGTAKHGSSRHLDAETSAAYEKLYLDAYRAGIEGRDHLCSLPASSSVPS